MSAAQQLVEHLNTLSWVVNAVGKSDDDTPWIWWGRQYEDTEHTGQSAIIVRQSDQDTPSAWSSFLHPVLTIEWLLDPPRTADGMSQWVAEPTKQAAIDRLQTLLWLVAKPGVHYWGIQRVADVIVRQAPSAMMVPQGSGLASATARISVAL